MTVKNKYVNNSKISEGKFREIIKYFALDLEANKIRERISECCMQHSDISGIIEIDESYFGAKRVKGKRGRRALCKIKVFGLLKRGDKIYTQIVDNCSRKTLQSIIKKHVNKDSEIHSDGWRAYNGLVDLGYKKHYRVDHSKNEFANKNKHINGIENFWGIAKVRLMRFIGLPKKTFYLHLKECKFRFNNRTQNLYKILLKIFRKKPLKLS